MELNGVRVNIHSALLCPNISDNGQGPQALHPPFKGGMKREKWGNHEKLYFSVSVVQSTGAGAFVNNHCVDQVLGFTASCADKYSATVTYRSKSFPRRYNFISRQVQLPFWHGHEFSFYICIQPFSPWAVREIRTKVIRDDYFTLFSVSSIADTWQLTFEQVIFREIQKKQLSNMLSFR